MYRLQLLGVLFAAHWCLGNNVHETHLKDCSFTGEFPAPWIFLNVSEAEEGDWLSARCVLPSDFSVIAFFLCKDGEAKSAHKAVPHDIAYTWAFQISEQSAGQYSCGYKVKDKNNQEKKSAVSAPWKLIVLPGELPAPHMFLNVSEAREGDSVAVRCTLSSCFSVTAFFLCKDGEAKSIEKAMPQDLGYTWAFQVSEQSAGLYSCGYKVKDKNNQEKKSALSAAGKLTVLPRNHAESSGGDSSSHGQTMPLYVWILRFSMVILLLVSAPIFNCFWK